MELCERDRPVAPFPGHTDHGFERRERHAHVRRVRGDALVARPENRVHAVEAVDGRTPGARLTLVAGRGGVVEVIAARALQEVAAVGGHVAELRRCARQDRPGEERIPPFHLLVVRRVRVGHERAEAQAAPVELLDPIQRKARDVDEATRPRDVFLHQVDEIGPAGNEHRCMIRGDLAHGRCDVGGSRVREVVHRVTLLSAEPMAC